MNPGCGGYLSLFKVIRANPARDIHNPSRATSEQPLSASPPAPEPFAPGVASTAQPRFFLSPAGCAVWDGEEN